MCEDLGFFEIQCKKCDGKVNTLTSIETGYTWSLYKCDNCGQLHASANRNGYLPDEVLNDNKIIKIDIYGN